MTVEQTLPPDEDCQAISEQNQLTDSRRSKRKCLIALVAIMTGFGLIAGMLPEDEVTARLIECLMILAIAFVVLIWCHVDAGEQNFTISFRLSLLILLALIIGFPYYIFITRKNGPVLKTLILAALFFILLNVLNVIGYELGCMVYNARYG